MRRHALFLMLTGVACGAAWAAPAGAATSNASVRATVIKPLTLTSLQDLDFGTIMLQPGTWSGATVSLSRDGVLSCASANLTCSGATQAAQYKVTGSNKETVIVSAPNVILTNQSDPTQTLTMVVDSPGPILLTSSGQPGVDFGLGGSITLSSTTATGTYSGTFSVTVDYQ